MCPYNAITLQSIALSYRGRDSSDLILMNYAYFIIHIIMFYLLYLLEFRQIKDAIFNCLLRLCMIPLKCLCNYVWLLYAATVSVLVSRSCQETCNNVYFETKNFTFIFNLLQKNFMQSIQSKRFFLINSDSSTIMHHLSFRRAQFIIFLKLINNYILLCKCSTPIILYLFVLLIKIPTFKSKISYYLQ